MQQAVVWIIVGFALVAVLANVVKQVRSLFGKPDEGCPGCGSCPASKRVAGEGVVSVKHKGKGPTIPLQPTKRH